MHIEDGPFTLKKTFGFFPFLNVFRNNKRILWISLSNLFAGESRFYIAKILQSKVKVDEMLKALY